MKKQTERIFLFVVLVALTFAPLIGTLAGIALLYFSLLGVIRNTKIRKMLKTEASRVIFWGVLVVANIGVAQHGVFAVYVASALILLYFAYKGITGGR